MNKKISKLVLSIFFTLLVFNPISNAQVTLEWVKGIHGNGNGVSEHIAVDASGNVYTAGYFYDSFDFDPGPGTTFLASMGIADVFISKLDSKGNFLWAKRLGGKSDDKSLAIALDPLGNVYVGGGFGDTVDFDPGSGTLNLIADNTYNQFILKLDSSGNIVWAKRIGTWGAFSITVDTASNVFTTGLFSGTTDFDPGAGNSEY